MPDLTGPRQNAKLGIVICFGAQSASKDVFGFFKIIRVECAAPVIVVASDFLGGNAGESGIHEYRHDQCGGQPDLKRSDEPEHHGHRQHGSAIDMERLRQCHFLCRQPIER